MLEEKPKLIKTIGIIVVVISAFSILSSIFGLFMFDSLAKSVSAAEQNPYSVQSLAYIKPLAILSIIISLGFLMVGLYIMRYNKWARILVLIFAVPALISIWWHAFFIAPYNPFDRGEFDIEHVIGAILYSAPIIFLIKYLNKEKIKNHFA
jgi:hypothetical protein